MVAEQGAEMKSRETKINKMLYQVGTINSLLGGVYEGDVSFADLAHYGDFGLVESQRVLRSLRDQQAWEIRTLAERRSRTWPLHTGQVPAAMKELSHRPVMLERVLRNFQQFSVF